MIHVPGTLLLVHYLGFAGAGWAVVVMRTAHLSFTICEHSTPFAVRQLCQQKQLLLKVIKPSPAMIKAKRALDCIAALYYADRGNVHNVCSVLAYSEFTAFAVYLLTLGRRYSRFEEAGEDPSAGSNKVHVLTVQLSYRMTAI